MKITIYSTTTCPYCNMLKTYLNEKNINFEEKFVDSDDSARQEMIGESGGFLGVPFTIIVTEQGQSAKIIGFDKKKIDSVLNI